MPTLDKKILNLSTMDYFGIDKRKLDAFVLDGLSSSGGGIGGIDAYTKLMLHMDGADNGTVFTDECGKTVSVTGNTCTKTAVKKFGTASAYFDGSGDDLHLAHSADWDFGSGDFTLETIVNFSDVSKVSMLMGSISNPNGWGLMWVFDNTLHLYSSWNADVSVSWTPTQGDTYHVACVRSGSSIKFFVEGVQVGADKSAAATYNSDGNGLYIGRASVSWGGSGYLDHKGYMDELRISKGIARWTSDFTPPAEPYSVA